MSADIDIAPTIQGIVEGLHWASHFAKQLGGTAALESVEFEGERRLQLVVLRDGAKPEAVAMGVHPLVVLRTGIDRLWLLRDEATKKPRAPRSAA